MTKKKLAPRRVSCADTVAFADACEAWLWYVRCQVARDEGARFVANSGLLARPCEPDDFFCAVLQLIRKGILGNLHLRVSMAYGLRDYPPDLRCREEEAHARLWDEALDRLTTILREKGIVACDMK